MVGEGIPAHRQAALQGHLGDVDAVGAVNRDAVVAKGHAADNPFAGQGATTAAQPILQTLQPQDRTAMAVLGWRHGGSLLPLGAEVAGQVLVAEHRGGGGCDESDFLAQPVEGLLQGDTTKPNRSQQIFGADQVATARHPGHGIAMEQGIEAIAAQLPLQHGRAPQDVLIAVAALIPTPDAITGRGGGHKVEPIEARMGRLGGHHLHEVAVLQGRRQGAKAIVDAHALAVIANFRVDAIGKIHGG